MRRLVCIIASMIVLSSAAPLRSQSCDECKRRIFTVTDVNIYRIRPPYFDVDSIRAFIGYMATAPIVTDLLSTGLQGSCIDVKGLTYAANAITAEQAQRSPALLTAVYNSKSFSGEGCEQYYLWPTIANMEGQLQCWLEMASLENKQIFSDSKFFPIGTDGATIAAALAALFVPRAEAELKKFEKMQKENGRLVKPKVSVIAETSTLKPGGATVLTIEMLDCDGEPAKQFTLPVEATLGTLDKTKITTDDNGRATVRFTAGSVPGIAQITTGVAEYTTPWGVKKATTVEGELIQIEDDQLKGEWYVTANYFVSNLITSQHTNDANGVVDHRESRSFETQTVKYSAWLNAKDIPPIPDPAHISLPYTFINEAGAIKLSYIVTNTISGASRSYYENMAGTITENAGWSSSSRETPTKTPVIALNVNDLKFAYKITNISANRKGTSASTKATLSKLTGKRETVQSDASPTENFTLSEAIQGEPYDTVYTKNTSNAATGTTEILYVTQKASVSWLDYVATLHYNSLYTKKTEQNNSLTGKDISEWVQQRTITLRLSMGDDSPTGVTKEDAPLPRASVLQQNYPNPFNPSTTISFGIPARSFVTLKVYDMMGRGVATLVAEDLQAGNYSSRWNAAGVPSGMYFYRLQAGAFTETRRLVLVK